MTVHVSQPSGNASPLAILKVATTAWRERGGSSDILRELTALYTTKGTIIPAENVPKYLADLQAHPSAKMIGFKLQPEAQAFLDADASADDAILAVADDAPATAPQEPQAKNEPARSPLHQAALEYVAKGRKLIPIVPGAKTPMRKKWPENKITTPEEVDAHWSQYPDSNIAFEPEDESIAIIEQDPGGDVGALDLPATFEVQSPRGGIHYYFVGTSPPTVQKLGPKIDTRGKGSYVLIPPSVVSGKPYRINANRPMAALPAEIEARLAAKVDARTSDIHELDLPSNIERARSRIVDLIEREDVAIQGKGGDTRTFKLACELVRDLGLSVDAAIEAIAPWNAACVPPWDEAELRAKLEHAAAYGQNEPGAYGTKRASETFGDALKADAGTKADDIPNEPDAEPQQEWQGPDPLSAKELASKSVKPLRYLIDGIVLAQNVNLLYGDGGVGKTYLAEQMAVALASGKPLFGHKVIQTPGFLVLGEDDDGPTKERLEAICRHYGCKLADIPLTTWCLPGYDITLARVSELGEIALYPFFARLRKELEKRRGHFVVLDALADLADLNENNRIAVNKFLKRVLPPLCRDYEASLLALGHASKSSMESKTFYSGTTAWNAAVRNRLVLEAPGDTEMDRRTTNHRFFHVTKVNYGQPKTLELFMIGKPPIFVDGTNVEVADNERLTSEAILATTIKMLKQGIQIVRTNGNGQKPADIAVQVKKDFRYSVSRKLVLEVLGSAEREGRLAYRKGGSHGQAGFYIPDNPPARSPFGEGGQK